MERYNRQIHHARYTIKGIIGRYEMLNIQSRGIIDRHTTLDIHSRV